MKNFHPTTIRAMQTETTLRLHVIPIRLAKIGEMNLDSSCYQGCRVGGSTRPLLVGMKTCTATLEISVDGN